MGPSYWLNSILWNRGSCFRLNKQTCILQKISGVKEVLSKVSFYVSFNSFWEIKIIFNGLSMQILSGYMAIRREIWLRLGMLWIALSWCILGLTKYAQWHSNRKSFQQFCSWSVLKLSNLCSFADINVLSVDAILLKFRESLGPLCLLWAVSLR